MSWIPCAKCGGTGSPLESTSLWVGPPSDVECRECKGSGAAKCEKHGCSEDAAGFDDDGNALCNDCLMEWAMNYSEDA